MVRLQFHPLAVVLLCAILTYGLDRPQTPAAIVEFNAINARMQEAKPRRDWQRYRTLALSLTHLLNGSPDALLEMARADARIGARQRALEELNAIAHMGQYELDIKNSHDFASLRRTTGFGRVVATMSANLRPISHAAIAVTVGDASLLPEDIGYDPQSGKFLVASVLEKKIVTIDRAGDISEFARAPDGWPMLALKIDLPHHVVWATEVALQGFADVPKSSWGRSIILEYDLRSRKLLGRIEGPRASQLGDMTITPNGDLLICDSNGGGVYLLNQNGKSLKRVDGGDFISPMTPSFISNDRVFVADYARGLAVFDLRNKHVRWIPMQNMHALQGIDGLYYRNGRLIVIQNATPPERIVSLQFDPAFTHVTSERIIESGTPDIDPNHGIIVGDRFYYIANAGWNQLATNGTVKKGSRLTEARIMYAEIAK